MTEEERDEVLTKLHEDLDVSKNLLWTVKEQVQKNDISNYPIFVATTEILDLGKLVIDKNQLGINWFFFASHLEEFAVKQIEQLAEQGLDQVHLYTLNRPQWAHGILHALKPAKLAKSA